MTRTPFCPKCVRWFRYGPPPYRCPACNTHVEIREVTFEHECAAMPRGEGYSIGQRKRHAKAAGLA